MKGQTEHRRMRGFTLVEMAVVMLIVSLLLGGLLLPLSNRVEQERRSVAQEAMEQAMEALVGYALSTGRLPCPDVDNDGLEDLSGCQQVDSAFNAGTLPWATLNIQGGDPWDQNRSFGYAVNGAFVSTTTPFTLSTVGTGSGILQVYDGVSGGCSGAGQVAVNVPAILYSNAKNDYGVTAGSSDEQENADNDNCFISRGYSTAAGSEFDDLVGWLSPNILFNRMVAAGRLP
ncbi:MAG TPA: type II secretion system protein [Gammaproteobacteria bacterium]|nr:type II secretion system protein [Gammaproteobacteria bacterium]